MFSSLFLTAVVLARFYHRNHKTLPVTGFGNGSGSLSVISQAIFLIYLALLIHKHHHFCIFIIVFRGVVGSGNNNWFPLLCLCQLDFAHFFLNKAGQMFSSQHKMTSFSETGNKKTVNFSHGATSQRSVFRYLVLILVLFYLCFI